MPSVYAVTPNPTPNTLPCTVKCAGATRKINMPQPRTCSAITATLIPMTLRR
ncbi:Uncharacterised protein [Mycobacteroides abscessus subsp. abscessus]|nr:Uncharacterised protein [Mycobacteroides abscessus subsp. abscessus]SKT94523.1 Uncharacterised protein [Mycobacteroides abscessus subsp. abscessus]